MRNRMKKWLSTLLVISMMVSAFSFVAPYPSVFAVEGYQGTPFKGNPIAIPGDVRFSDYDVGAVGETHYRGGNATVTAKYRQSDCINIFDSTAAGQAFIQIGAGVWGKYTIDVAEDDEYEAILEYTHNTLDTNKNPPQPMPISLGFEISVDDVVVLKNEIELKATGGWDEKTMATANLGKISLKAGTHVLKYTQLKGGMHASKITLNESYKGTPFKGNPIAIPGDVRFSDYDIGDVGKTHFRSANANSTSKYRPGAYLMVMDRYPNNGKAWVVYSPGVWGKYTVDVAEDGEYTAYIDYATTSASSEFEMSVDDVVVLKKELKATTGWGDNNIGTAKLGKIQLKAGKHVLKFSQFKLGIHADQITFKKWEQTELYVSTNGSDDITATGKKDRPFATLKRAKEEIAKLSADMDGDIIVNVAPGYYQLSETEKFGIEHSGKNGYNVIIRGEDTANPPIISGGLEVTGWERMDDGIYKAQLDTAGRSVRNLYINGHPSIRARSKYQYLYEETFKADPAAAAEDGLSVTTANFPKFKNPKGIELIWDIDWLSTRMVVENIVADGEKTHIYMSPDAWKKRIQKSAPTTSVAPGKYFFVENAKELLDEPGEFFYDKDEKYIYYYPYENENMSTAETYVGNLEFMMNISGASNTQKIENLMFDNLDFRYSEWYAVDRQGGLILVQADQMGTAAAKDETGIEGQIKLNWAKNVNFINCRFSCLGSTAIRMVEGVINCSVIGNVFRDLSGGGVSIGTTEYKKTVDKICSDIAVENNMFRRVANEYRGMPAVAVYYECDINIAHNDIFDVPYSGVSVGWGWGAYDSVNTKNIHVSYNHIENIMTSLYDGGPVYLLGNIPGCTVDNNYFKKANTSFAGVYPDSGSGNMKIYENVLENCRSLWFVGVGANKPHDNWAYDNFTDEYKATNLHDKIFNNKEFNTTIVQNGEWPEAARAIMNKAGTEPEYRALRELAAYPQWRYDIVNRVPKKGFTPKSSLLKIEAEDFLTGGQNVGYYKINEKPKNNQYRDDGVSLMRHPKGKGYVIQENFDNEWFKYEVDVARAGEYNFIIKGGQAWPINGPQPTVSIYIDDELVLENKQIRNGISTAAPGDNGGWYNFLDTNLGKIPVQAGKHHVKVFLNIGGFFFDYFTMLTDEQMAAEPDLLNDAPEFDEAMLISEQAMRKRLTDGYPTSKPCTVTFDVDGIQTEVTATTGAAIQLPADPTKTGFTFKGWYDAAVDGNKVTEFTTTMTVYAQWTANTKEPEQNNVLVSITTPAAITGVPNGTAKDAAALGLPVKVNLEIQTTTGGAIATTEGAISWDVASSSYNPASREAQTFMVEGTVTFPEGVVNPGEIPVTVSISVTVKAAEIPVIPEPEPTEPGTTPTPTPSPTPVPVKESDGSVKVDLKPVLDKETAVVKVDDKLLDKAIETAVANENGIKEVKLVLEEVKGAKEYEVELTVGKLSKSTDDHGIKIQTPLGTIAVTENMMQGIKESADSKVSLLIRKTDALPNAENKPVVEVYAAIAGKVIPWYNLDAPVTISIPYTPTKAELKHPGFITAWYINGADNKIPVPSARYDANEGAVVFRTTHFSKYAVAYVTKTFSDIKKHWSEERISILASKGVIDGVTEAEFMPNQSITRGEYIMWLMNTLGLTAKYDSNFSDVNKGDKYYEAVGMAKKLGITSGVGENKFAPERQISRQDLLVLTAKALKLAGRELSAGTVADMSKFADISQVANYAVNDVAAMIKNGIIAGDGTNIKPKDNTSRAEAATILYKLYSK